MSLLYPETAIQQDIIGIQPSGQPSSVAQQVTVLPQTHYSTAAVSSGGTFASGQLSGGYFTTFVETANAPGTINTRTAAQMFSDIPGADTNLNYMLRVIMSGTGTLTIGAGSNVTITGTATVSNGFRDFRVRMASKTNVIFQNVGSGNL